MRCALCDDDDDCDSDDDDDGAGAGVGKKMTMCVILENVCCNRKGSLNWANVATELNSIAGIMTELFPTPLTPPPFCCRSLKLRQLQFTHALVLLTRPYPLSTLFFLPLTQFVSQLAETPAF